MEKKDLKDLNELLSDLNRKYLINHGGCAYFAYVLAKNFEKLNIPFKVIIADSDRLSKGILDTNISCGHVALVVNRVLINPSPSRRYRNDYKKYDYIVKSSEILNYYKNCRAWNDDFDTDNIHTVEKQINKFFKKFKPSFIDKCRNIPNLTMCI